MLICSQIICQSTIFKCMGLLVAAFNIGIYILYSNIPIDRYVNHRQGDRWCRLLVQDASNGHCVGPIVNVVFRLPLSELVKGDGIHCNLPRFIG